MKKFVAILAVAIVVAMVASVGAAAFYTGEFAAERLEFDVPKINPKNPAIVIDGHADLNGEWYGAVKTGVNLQDDDAAEFAGFWDATVWSNSYPVSVSSLDDIPAEHRNIWDVYWLWDEAGLYFAVVCETDSTPTSFNPAFYLGGDTTGQTRRVDGFTPMIRPSDDDSVPYEWLEFWTSTLGTGDFWNDDSMNYYYNSGKNPWEIKTASWIDSEKNDKGGYTYNIEAFLPWDCLCYGTGTEKVVDDFEGKAGAILSIGNIFLDGDGHIDEGGNPDNWGRGFDCPGWANFNYYMLSATPAADAPAAEEPAAEEPAAEEPAAEEPAAEEPAAEEPAAEEPAEETVTPAPTTTTTTTKNNPKTADVSVLFYALAAVAAVGGISVFKRK